MHVFLVLLVLQVSTGNFQVRMGEYDSMAECQLAKALVNIPSMKDFAYFLDCVTFRDTTEEPA
jgi:hypothetical protein